MRYETKEWINTRISECQATTDRMISADPNQKRSWKVYGINQELNTLKRILKMENTKDFYVECNVCKQRLKNHTGSTPCCGSIAYLVSEDGSVSDSMSLFAGINEEEIKPAFIDAVKGNMKWAEDGRVVFEEDPNGRWELHRPPHNID